MSDTKIDTNKLIKAAMAEGKRGDQAAARLSAMGMPAASAIIDALRASPLDSVRRLTDVLLQIDDPQMISLMTKLLTDENVDVAMSAFQFLGQSDSEQALQPLLDQLSNPVNRQLAARVLGDLGDPGAIEGLLNLARQVMGDSQDPQSIRKLAQVAKEDADNSDLLLVITVAVALAKLGDHDMAPAVVFLTDYGRAEGDEYEDAIVRAEAVSALKHTVGAGMFPALQEALRDPVPDVRSAALDPLFYLGVKEAISELAEVAQPAQDEGRDIAENAFAMLYELTGEWPNDKTDFVFVEEGEVREWWQRREPDFDSGVCYRLGQPLSIPEVIALLRKKPNRWHRIIEELHIITGNDFGFDADLPAKAQDEVVERAEAWWHSEGDKFQAGHLYKYGHEQDLGVIY